MSGVTMSVSFLRAAASGDCREPSAAKLGTTVSGLSTRVSRRKRPAADHVIVVEVPLLVAHHQLTMQAKEIGLESAVGRGLQHVADMDPSDDRPAGIRQLQHLQGVDVIEADRVGHGLVVDPEDRGIGRYPRDRLTQPAALRMEGDLQHRGAGRQQRQALAVLAEIRHQLQRPVDDGDLERATEAVGREHHLVVVPAPQHLRQFLCKTLQPAIEIRARAVHQLMAENPVIHHVGEQQESPGPDHQDGEDRDRGQRGRQIRQRQPEPRQERGRIDRERHERQQQRHRIGKEQPVAPIHAEIPECGPAQDEIAERHHRADRAASRPDARNPRARCRARAASDTRRRSTSSARWRRSATSRPCVRGPIRADRPRFWPTRPARSAQVREYTARAAVPAESAHSPPGRKHSAF